MRAVLVAGSWEAGFCLEHEPPLEPGDNKEAGQTLASLASADLVVAVDGGGEVLSRMGVLPDLVVGDMDSISSETLAEIEQCGAKVVRLPTAKDETDTEAALRLAVSRGAEDITVYGALGGPRLDHLLGNLLLLTSPWLEGVRVRMVDGLHELFLVGGSCEVQGAKGDLVSLLPLSVQVDEVETEGLLYPLRGDTLFRASTRGVSNEMTGERARVSHGEGILLLVHYRGRVDHVK